MKKYWLYGLVLLFLDQITKFFARTMTKGQSIPIIKNIFHITYVQNRGGLFGMFQGSVMIIALLSVIMMGLLIYNWDELAKDKVSKILMIIIMTGIIGNLIDRFFLGYVTDFIDFRIWPVFNFADSYLTVSSLALVVKEISWKK
ncbi:MAG: Lipoprotein signal peptidase [Candidatus Woesearchaeota archaeon]|nr:Lipoprotein signal peptidase [Candidatus Woesearchaeota archaeon]